MVSINSTERRRRLRRAQELRAAFIDGLGVLGLAFAAALAYVILMMLAQ